MPERATRRSNQRGARACTASAGRCDLDVSTSSGRSCSIAPRELHQPGSPFGKVARQLRDEIAADLVADLVRLGTPARKRLERERVRMIADALIAQIDALAFGLIEGRYASVETAVDVLTGFALSLLAPPAR